MLKTRITRLKTTKERGRMFLQKRTTKNKKPKVKYSEYIVHEDEQKNLKSYVIDQDTEEELLANRYFLKRRVWKNIEKIRRSHARINRQFDKRDKKSFRPRRSSVYSSPRA